MPLPGPRPHEADGAPPAATKRFPSALAVGGGAAVVVVVIGLALFLTSRQKGDQHADSPTTRYGAVVAGRETLPVEVNSPFDKLQAKKAFKEANGFYQQQEYKKAADRYEDAVAADPELSVAFFYLGNSYDNLYKPSRKGEAENDSFLAKAIENYKKAADKETDPKMRRLALEYLVAAYGPDKVNDPTQAEPIVQRMIELEPQETANYFALSKIYEDSGDYEKAEATLLKSKEAKPNDPNVYLQIAGYYNRQEEFDKTIEALEQRATLEPNNPEAYYTISTYYWDKAYRDFRLKEDEKKGFVVKGVEAVDKAIALKSDYMEALTYKNLLLRLQANLEKDPAKQQSLIKEADRLRDQALELKKKKTSGL